MEQICALGFIFKPTAIATETLMSDDYWFKDLSWLLSGRSDAEGSLWQSLVFTSVGAISGISKYKTNCWCFKVLRQATWRRHRQRVQGSNTYSEASNNKKVELGSKWSQFKSWRIWQIHLGLIERLWLYVGENKKLWPKPGLFHWLIIGIMHH